MCTSKPKAPKPVPNAPVATPTAIDQQVVDSTREERQRQRRAYGRQSTILAGGLGGIGAPPTLPVKTALGA